MSLNALQQLSSAFSNDSGQILNSTIATPPLVANTQTYVPERYSGGTLSVKILKTDSQAQVAWRGLYHHAKEAGLDHKRAIDFADKWTTANTTLNHRVNGDSTPYTTEEFNTLKQKGKTTFDLTKEFDAEILADLNRRVDEITFTEDTPLRVETNIKLTAQERAQYEQKLAQAGQNRLAIQDKPILTLVDGKTKDGKPLTEDVALIRYIERNYNKDGRVWGDKINEMVAQAKAQGVKVDFQINEDNKALVGVSAADKEKLDKLFNQALGETIKGEQASLKGQQEATNQVGDIGRMYANGVINTVNHITEPARGTLETLGVDTSAAKIPKLEYQSEYGKKNGVAGEIGTEIGLGVVTAPSLLKTTVGKAVFGVSGTYNVAAGAAGIDPTERDANGNPREMGTLERGLRIVGGAGEILGARPNFGTAGKTGTTLAQTDEVIEALTPDGQVVRVEVPKARQADIDAADAKPVQTADDLVYEVRRTKEQVAADVAARGRRAERYAELVNSNQKWNWEDEFGDIALSERAKIKEAAVQSGRIPHILVDPVTKFADFSGHVVREIQLPRELWNSSDSVQFRWLDNQIGGRPAGTTWHHHQDDGRMQLVPLGIHDMTFHYGGRQTWATGQR